MRDVETYNGSITLPESHTMNKQLPQTVNTLPSHSERFANPWWNGFYDMHNTKSQRQRSPPTKCTRCTTIHSNSYEISGLGCSCFDYVGVVALYLLIPVDRKITYLSLLEAFCHISGFV